jgi:hypothetical protein
VFNFLFLAFFILGFSLRFADGKVISVAAGLCAGVIANELYKFVVWLLR